MSSIASINYHSFSRKLFGNCNRAIFSSVLSEKLAYVESATNTYPHLGSNSITILISEMYLDVFTLLL